MKPIVTGIVILIVSVVSAFSLYFWGGRLGAETIIDKAIIWLCITAVCSLIFFIPLIIRFFWLKEHDRFSNIKHLNPEDLSGDSAESTHLIGVLERWEQL